MGVRGSASENNLFLFEALLVFAFAAAGRNAPQTSESPGASPQAETPPAEQPKPDKQKSSIERKRRECHELRVRFADTFPNTYLTVLGVIQGAALALLFAKFDARIAHHHGLADYFLLVAYAAFIALVWNQYQMGVMLFRWTPDLWDALIPFALGFFELLGIVWYYQHPAYLLAALGAFFAACVFAFTNEYGKTRAMRNVTGSVLHAMTHAFPMIDVSSCVVSVIASVAAAAAIWPSRVAEPGPWVPGGVLMGLVVLHATRQYLMWRHVTRKLTAEQKDAGDRRANPRVPMSAVH